MEIYFQDSRFDLSTFGEFLVRFVARSFYFVFAALTLLLIFSDVRPLRWLGFIFALFLIDRLLHFGQGEKDLSELRGKKINVAHAVTPAAAGVTA
jgi:hypothetical protein